MYEEFDEIRPYHDEELPQIYEELIADPQFREAVAVVLPDVPVELWAQQMRACKTKTAFQKTFCYPLLWRLVKEASDGLTGDFHRLSATHPAYTYISNHRDIILDSGFLSILLVDNSQDTVEIAIGDNLLIYPWIRKLVRVNKAFIVQRALTMRKMLEASALMSRYIHHTICDKRQSVWIAQREGRAKDSNDCTQESVLKMLSMGGEGSVIDRLKQLHIAPLAISYEYDPCDYLKAKEFQLKRDNPDYKKTSADDLLNMKTGLFGYKGKIHFQTSDCIDSRLEAIDKTLPNKEIFAQIAALIDKGIHCNYRLYPNNYIALDLLQGERKHAEHYTPDDEQRFHSYMEQQLARIELPHKDTAFLRDRLLTMYANPAINQLKATKGL